MNAIIRNFFCMKIILICIIVCGSSLISFAQNNVTFTLYKENSNTIISGATILLPALSKATITDSTGKAVFINLPNGKYDVAISGAGYLSVEKSITISENNSSIIYIFYLEPSFENIEEVIVSSTRTNSRIKDIPVRVEVLGDETLNEEGNMRPSNIAMLLAEATGIQSQQTSSVNGNISIRLQGLDGKYTQILKDGFPLYGGFAQGLSIMQIPPLDFKQIEIIKGSSAALYGGDAIAGIINLITKQPVEKKELTILLNKTSLGGEDINAFFAKKWKKFGLTFLTANNFQSAKDISKNGFSEMPETKTFTLAPVLHYYVNATTKLRLGFNVSFDKRKGGDMVVLNNGADNGHTYFEENVSNRIATQFQFDKQLNKTSGLTFKNSIAFFKRSINTSNSLFSGKQASVFSELVYKRTLLKHQVVAGISLISDQFKEDTLKSHLRRNYNYQTFGLFAQDDWKIANKLTVETGMRIDFQNQFNLFVLPRLAILYKINENFYLRAGAGIGYKLPTIFSTASEEAGINTIAPLNNNILPEKSAGENLDINYKTIINGEIMATINQSFFITQINNPLILEGQNFINKQSPIVTRGFETSIRLKMENFQLFTGYTFVDAQRRYIAGQNAVPLTPMHKIVSTLSYEKEDNFTIGTEFFYNSSMFRDFDARSKAYTVVGLMIQKHFKYFSLIFNCENIFDQRQTRFEDIVNPPFSNPTFKQIYAPLDGRIFNIAVRIKL